MLGFLVESSDETRTIGSFSYANDINSYENALSGLHDTLLAKNIDFKTGINTIIKNRPLIESVKDTLMEPLRNDCERLDSKMGDNRYRVLCEQTEQVFDNCVEDLITESTRVGNLLPIKGIDLPIVIKQNVAIASKDIIQTEVTPTPIIKKHIQRRWIVDEKSKKRWEYPQCFFKDDFKEIFAAGKGLPIKNDDVDITTGIFDYNIAQNLTDSADHTREKLSYNIKIISAHLKDNSETVKMDMRVNLADSTWVGGKVIKSTGEHVDTITGTIDFLKGTVSISCAAGKVDKIKFSGYLSNEYNERTVTYDVTREEREWKIEDGFRIDVPYSLEELQDAKALLNYDLYKETYNDLTDILIHMEDNEILKFLDDEFTKYEGVSLDPLGFNSFIQKKQFDCDHTHQTVALQSTYIQEMLKFYIDRFVTKMADTAKMEDMTFVIYGNPRFIALLDAHISWAVRAGDTLGGIKMNYSYGVMNSGNVKIQVVSTMKYSATDTRHLRIIPYPLNNQQMTFKHYKYTSHILTSQDSGYRPVNRPGGSMTYLLGTIRNTTVSLQGIQGAIELQNTAFD